MAEQKLRDAEIRKTALPDEATKVMTPEERRESGKRISELMAGLTAAAKADDAMRAETDSTAEAAAHDLRQRARQSVTRPDTNPTA